MYLDPLKKQVTDLFEGQKMNFHGKIPSWGPSTLIELTLIVFDNITIVTDRPT